MAQQLIGLVAAVVVLTAASGYAEAQAPAQKTTTVKHMTVMGSQMVNGKWRSTNLALKKGAQVTIAAQPMDSLNGAQEHITDALVFRVGETGDEYAIGSDGRQRLLQRLVGQEDAEWKNDPERTFTANTSGDLYYTTRQNKKFKCRITVEQ